jgi:ATP-dependent phosphofructokinase / diphosphate-dependent phosphofructokinase
MKKVKCIGILTAGGDSPGLNAAIRAVGKAAIGKNGWEIVGFRDGYLGMAQDEHLLLKRKDLSGILTIGGTVLGTSRDKVHRMVIDGIERDMTAAIVANYKKHRLDALVCIGGGGTLKNALRLAEKGLRVITLPKTIDKDIALTDATIGFDTALGIATEAIDRLHSTAHSHHRIIIAEIMGHKAGWLTLGAGLAGGADVILVPEIPYDLEKIAAAIRRRSKAGTNFSIVAVAEGARSREDAAAFVSAKRRSAGATTPEEKEYAKLRLAELVSEHAGNTVRLAKQLEGLTELEARMTILGYVQRGGTPSPSDRLLATRLGTACVDLIARGTVGVMVGASGQGVRPVPIEAVAGRQNLVPLNHSWFAAARSVGTCMGD